MDNTTLTLMLIPLVLIQIGLAIFALYDMYQRKGARPPLPTWAWILIIIVINILGPIIYFTLGRKEDYA